MAKSSKKKPKTRSDLAQNAYRVMMEATGQLPKTPDPNAGKDPAAGSLGRKGGHARAKVMGKTKRAANAKKAATARWGRSG
jgi:hypothetical protein